MSVWSGIDRKIKNTFDKSTYFRIWVIRGKVIECKNNSKQSNVSIIFKVQTKK